MLGRYVSGFGTGLDYPPSSRPLSVAASPAAYVLLVALLARDEDRGRAAGEAHGLGAGWRGHRSWSACPDRDGRRPGSARPCATAGSRCRTSSRSRPFRWARPCCSRACWPCSVTRRARRVRMAAVRSLPACSCSASSGSRTASIRTSCHRPAHGAGRPRAARQALEFMGVGVAIAVPAIAGYTGVLVPRVPRQDGRAEVRLIAAASRGDSAGQLFARATSSCSICAAFIAPGLVRAVLEDEARRAADAVVAAERDVALQRRDVAFGRSLAGSALAASSRAIPWCASFEHQIALALSGESPPRIGYRKV